MNQCHFLGNLTHEPELRETKSGKKVVNFSIAVNDYRKGLKQEEKEPLFIRCEAWDTGAETIAKWFTTGKPIIVHGNLKWNTWEKKEADGTMSKQRTLCLRVSHFDFVPTNPGPGKRDEAAANTPPAGDGDESPSETDDGDGIPF